MTKPKAEPDKRYARKLSPELAQRARQDRLAGVSVSEIARRLGVGRSSVQAILSGRAYRVPLTPEQVDAIFEDMNSKFAALMQPDPERKP